MALHRARALLGEKEIRLRHIERALRRLAESHPPPLIQVPDKYRPYAKAHFLFAQGLAIFVSAKMMLYWFLFRLHHYFVIMLFLPVIN